MMSAVKKVALVTGGNKGIGFAIVEGLCRSFQGDVILGSRDLQRGEAAVEKLKAKGLNPILHQLEISEPASLAATKKFLLDNYGGLDVLVNNAAIAFPVKCDVPFEKQAEETMRINYSATIAACRELFPILRAGARVVNVSSSCGLLFQIPGENIRQRLTDASLSQEDVDSMAQEYLEAVNQRVHLDKGWSGSAYCTSKVLMTAWTLLQQKKFDADTDRPDIVINATHPGYVKTDMARGKGVLSIEEGAKSSIFAATIPPNQGPKGKLIWYTCDAVDWARDELRVMEKPLSS